MSRERGKRGALAALGRAVTLALASLALGCSFTTSSTATGTHFGYDRPPKLAIVTRGSAPLVDAWRTALREAVAAKIVDDAPLGEGAPDALHEPMCRKAIELAARGTPVDDVVAIITDELSDDRTRCKAWRHTRDFFSRLTDGDDQADDRVCDDVEPGPLAASASVELRVIDASTCRPTRSASFEVERPPGGASAPTSASRAHVAKAARLATRLFPRGLAILGVRGREIEVSHRGAPLRPGQIYVVRGHEPGAFGTLGRMRVARVDGDRATLEAESDDVGVGVGDELRTPSITHRWTLYPLLSFGAVRDDEGRHGTGGTGIALRWSPRELAVHGEVEYSFDVSPGPDIWRGGVGVATGLRLPLGPVVPLLIVEGGLVVAYQYTLQENVAKAPGVYYGAGLGAEIWLRRAFIFVDARYRKLVTDIWRLNDESGIPVTVPHPDLRTDQITVRLAAGWRF